MALALFCGDCPDETGGKINPASAIGGDGVGYPLTSKTSSPQADAFGAGRLGRRRGRQADGSADVGFKKPLAGNRGLSPYLPRLIEFIGCSLPVKVLLVEDEPALASFIRKGFQNEGYDIEVAYDGRVGQSLLRQNTYGLVILDINLPYVNGIALCREVRATMPGVPVLLLTALDSLDDKVLGFEAGADDYLVKPFEFRELLMRARALTRRQAEAGTNQLLRIADLELDLTAKVVMRGGQRIDLTTREYSLLEYLLVNRGRVISRVDIAEKVWSLNFDTNTNVIDVYVSYLRKKLDKGHDVKLIHTVVGMGYVLREG